MATGPTVRGCIRAQIGNKPFNNGTPLGNLNLDTGVLEGCLNSNIPLPPGIPYAHGSIDPNWTVGELIQDADARQAAGGAGGGHLMAVLPAHGSAVRALFKAGRPPKVKRGPSPGTQKPAGAPQNRAGKRGRR